MKKEEPTPQLRWVSRAPALASHELALYHECVLQQLWRIETRDDVGGWLVDCEWRDVPAITVPPQ